MVTPFNSREKKITLTNIFFPKSCFYFAIPTPPPDHKRTLIASSLSLPSINTKTKPKSSQTVILLKVAEQTCKNNYTLGIFCQCEYHHCGDVVWEFCFLQFLGKDQDGPFYGNIYSTTGYAFPFTPKCPPWSCHSCQLPHPNYFKACHKSLLLPLTSLTHNVMASRSFPLVDKVPVSLFWEFAINP